MIRHATSEDIPQIVAMGEKFHDAAQLPCGYNPAAVTVFCENMVANGVILISKSGMIGGVMMPAYCDPKWSIAVELFWWAEKGGIDLLKAFEKWAVDSRADEVRMTSLVSLERANRLLKAKGYEAAEISHRKVL